MFVYLNCINASAVREAKKTTHERWLRFYFQKMLISFFQSLGQNRLFDGRLCIVVSDIARASQRDVIKEKKTEQKACHFWHWILWSNMNQTSNHMKKLLPVTKKKIRVLILSIIFQSLMSFNQSILLAY